MTLYFHDTTIDKLAQIQENGLVPQTNYRLPAFLRLNKMLSDEVRTSEFLQDALFTPRTYLWGSTHKDITSDVRLQIALPKPFPIERDYEQFTFFYLSMASSGNEQNMATFNKMLSDYGTALRVDGKSIEKDMRTIKAVVDGLSESQWMEYNAFRTSELIESQRITVLRNKL